MTSYRCIINCLKIMFHLCSTLQTICSMYNEVLLRTTYSGNSFGNKYLQYVHQDNYITYLLNSVESYIDEHYFKFDTCGPNTF